MLIFFVSVFFFCLLSIYCVSSPLLSDFYVILLNRFNFHNLSMGKAEKAAREFSIER